MNALLAQIGPDEINAARDFLSLDLVRLLVFILILVIVLLAIIAYFVLRPNKNNNDAIKAANDAAVSANKAAESANLTTQSALKTLNQHQEVLKGLTDTVSEFRQSADADRKAITGNTEATGMLHSAVEQIAAASKAVADAVEKSIKAEDLRHSSVTGGLSLVQRDIDRMSRDVMDKLVYLSDNLDQRWGSLSREEVGALKKSILHVEEMVGQIYRVVVLTPPPLPVESGTPPPAAAVSPVLSEGEKTA